MEIQVPAPDLRGTVLILNLKLTLGRTTLIVGTVEISPVITPPPEESHERTGL